MLRCVKCYSCSWLDEQILQPRFFSIGSTFMNVFVWVQLSWQNTATISEPHWIAAFPRSFRTAPMVAPIGRGIWGWDIWWWACLCFLFLNFMVHKTFWTIIVPMTYETCTANGTGLHPPYPYDGASPSPAGPAASSLRRWTWSLTSLTSEIPKTSRKRAKLLGGGLEELTSLRVVEWIFVLKFDMGSFCMKLCWMPWWYESEVSKSALVTRKTKHLSGHETQHQTGLQRDPGQSCLASWLARSIDFRRNIAKIFSHETLLNVWNERWIYGEIFGSVGNFSLFSPHNTVEFMCSCTQVLDWHRGRVQDCQGAWGSSCHLLLLLLVVGKNCSQVEANQVLRGSFEPAWAVLTWEVSIDAVVFLKRKGDRVRNLERSCYSGWLKSLLTIQCEPATSCLLPLSAT